MKKIVYSFLFICFIVGCKTKKNVPITTEVVKPKASWMITPPQDPNYYVGIGMVDKAIERNDYPSTSKKRALNDLASSIKVNISSNSILYQMEQSSTYDENYTSLIKSSSNLDLEGFELVDTWENEREYWAYYRLSKKLYLDFQQEKKKLASEKALNHYNLATQYESSNSIDLALKNYLDGLFILKEYLGEQVIVTIDQKERDLNNELYQGIQNCLSNIKITTNRSTVAYKTSSKLPLNIPVSIENTKGSISKMVISTTYMAEDQFNNISKKSSVLKSSHDGICRFSYDNLSKKPALQTIKFQLDITQIPVNEKDEKLKKAIFSSLILPEKLVEVRIEMPRVYLLLDEKNINEVVTTAGVGSFISNGLAKEDINIVASKNNVDFVIEVISNTETSGVSRGIYSAQLTTSIKVKNQEEHIVFQKSLAGINGSQLTYKKAGLEAYKNAEDEIKFKLLKELLKELL